MVKLPLPPSPAVLRSIRRPADVVVVARTTALARVHSTAGPHPLGWGEMRETGPLRSARFDTHPVGAGGPGRAPGHGVAYFGLSMRTCLAEAFQATRRIDRTARRPYLTVVRLTRPVDLLDLGGTWPTRAGASQAISSGRRDHSRSWARAIREAWPELDGLWYPSSMDAGEPAVCLWAPAADALPSEPDVDLPLDHPGLALPLARAAAAIGYRLA